jgi:hypothetical protein
MDTTSVSVNTPDFGIFSQLQEYGPIGLAALALGFVAWQFIKRKLAEKDLELDQFKSKKRKK